MHMSPLASAEVPHIPKEPHFEQIDIVSREIANIMIRALGQGEVANDSRNKASRQHDWESILNTNASHPKLADLTENMQSLFEEYEALFLPGQTKPTLESKELNHIADTFSHEVLSALVIGMYRKGRPEFKSFDDFPMHQEQVQKRYDRALETLFKDAPAGSNRNRYFERLTTQRVVAQILLKPEILLT